MFYIMYLDGLCSRRHWPAPLFIPSPTPSGSWTCTVRVNNREYTTGHSISYATEALARDAAAIQAYMICRSFSHNDGMFPGQRPGGGPGVQGLPVAIGSGRNVGAGGARGVRQDGRVRVVGERGAQGLSVRPGFAGGETEGPAESGSSGGESPKSVDSAVFAGEGGRGSGSGSGGRVCACGRNERCDVCLRETRWTP